MGIDTGTLILLLCFIALATRLIVLIFPGRKDKSRFYPDANTLCFTEVLLVSAFSTCLLFLLFTALSGWILSFHKYTPLEDVTPDIRPYLAEYDGIEAPVLYVFMIADILLAFFFATLFRKLKDHKAAYGAVMLIMLLPAAYYFYCIGLCPPLASIAANNLTVPISFGLLSSGLYFLYKSHRLLARGLVLAFIAFAGLISFTPTFLFDFSFVLAPALRVLHGYKFSEIYFQYDIFLSLLALVWMKLNLALAWFSYFGWTSFFLLFFALFYLADGLFKTRGLSVLFIVALVLVRLYALDPGSFQVLPLRLDLWVIPLLILYRKGPSHWLLGFCMAVLVLVHRNLGLLYLGSYAELLIILFLAELADINKPNLRSAFLLVVVHLKKSMLNLLFIAASIVLCYVFFHELVSDAAITYRKIGIGMTQISKHSFYWYFPPVLCSLVLLVWTYRNKLGSRYMSTAFFTALLAIGNSMYFFGRSHENNILNISAALTLTLFLFFDLLIYLFPGIRFNITLNPAEKSQVAPGSTGAGGRARNVSGRFFVLLPVLFIVIAGYFYSQSVSNRLGTQYENFRKGQIAYSLPCKHRDLASVKTITHNSGKVYFFDFGDDFYYYYYGRYEPLGYYSPCTSWVFKKDLVDFVQDLLEKGYHVVYNTEQYYLLREYVPVLKYRQWHREGNMVALTNATTGLLLPEPGASQFHAGFIDPSGQMDVDNKSLMLQDSFTIELLVKPTGRQVSDATVLSNVPKNNKLSGFQLQLDGDSQNHYTFILFNDTGGVSRLRFRMADSIWNYVTILVNDKNMKVCDNGKLLATCAAGAGSFFAPYVNNEAPLTIGNRADRSTPFKGYFKELKLANGSRSEEEVIKMGKAPDKTLNAAPKMNLQ